MTAVRPSPGCPDYVFSLGFPVARLLPYFLVGNLGRPAEDLAEDNTSCRRLRFEYRTGRDSYPWLPLVACRPGEWPGREALGATQSPAGTRTWKRPCTDTYRDRITHSGRSD